MIKKNCPICKTDKDSKLVYKKNLPNFEDIDYSGRKNPDGYHYEMVRCEVCSLLYASSIYEADVINQLYRESDFDYTDQISGLKKTYNNCLDLAEKKINKKQNFLEIGCGNGYILEEALKRGWQNVTGVEPSLKAISNSSKGIKNYIINKSFDPKDFDKATFDLVFFAMLIEHVPNVNKFLSDIYSLLKPGGIVLGIAHDERHFLSRLLKNKHPIVNDEHAYIFGKKTLKIIFSKNEFIDTEIFNLKNYYSLSYWLKMLPISEFIKKKMKFVKYIKKDFGIKAGNIFIISKKNN